MEESGASEPVVVEAPTTSAIAIVSPYSPAIGRNPQQNVTASRFPSYFLEVPARPKSVVISSAAKNLLFLDGGKQQIPRRCAPRNDKRQEFVNNRRLLYDVSSSFLGAELSTFTLAPGRKVRSTLRSEERR